MRIFTAIPLPPDTRAALAALTQARIPTARWEAELDFHITLRFIGDVDVPTCERYSAALRDVQAAPFMLALSGVGRFPPQPSRPARVLWAGAQPSSALGILQARISAALDAQGLPPDRHAGYTPHVTLARLNGERPLPQLDDFLRRHAAFRTPPAPITDFVIYESRQGDDGSKYQVVESYALTA